MRLAWRVILRTVGAPTPVELLLGAVPDGRVSGLIP